MLDKNVLFEDGMKVDCSVVQQLWQTEGEGRTLLESEKSLIAHHLMDCDGCRAEQAAVSAIRYRPLEGPASIRDELTARRQVDRALAQTALAEQTLALQQMNLRTRKPSAIWFGVGAAAAAAVAIAMAIGFLGDDQQNQRSTIPTPSNPAALPPMNASLGGEVLLSAGQIGLTGRESNRGQIHESTSLVIKDGIVVAKLDTGVKLHCAKNANLKFSKLNRQALDIELHRGRIFADVDPTRRGPPVVVKSPHGSVEVKGTVFSVDVTPQNTMVRVLRGTVSVTSASGAQQTVSDGQIFAIGNGVITEIKNQTLSDRDDPLHLLDLVVAQEAVELQVNSVPSGAILTVDGIELGQTPLTAMVRAGTRKFKLSLAGHESVKELLHLSAGSKVTRLFELSQLGGLSADESVRHSQARTQAPQSPERLLLTAQTHRKAQRWRDAHRAYQKLAQRFPDSALGRSALVSKGNIELERLNQFADALKSYNRYLSTTKRGTLAQEAMFGKAQALRALGRFEREKEVLEQFLTNFPKAIQHKRVQKRLKQLK